MALEEDPSGAICCLVRSMSRLLHALVFTGFASLSVGCAERAKSEDSPTPSAPIAVTAASTATISSSAMPINGVRLHRFNDLRNAPRAVPSASAAGQPDAPAAPPN